MPTSHTVDTIKNLALDTIGEPPLSGSSNAASRFLERWFDHTVEVELQANAWNFATDYAELNQDVSYDATSRWAYRYQLPPNALRLLPPTYNGERYGRPLDHKVTMSGVLLNSAAPFKSWWVFRVMEPGEWSPLFAQLVIGSLGLAMANKFTGKTSYVQLCMQMRQDALDKAEEINAFEGSMEPIEQHDILRVRGLGYSSPEDGSGWR